MAYKEFDIKKLTVAVGGTLLDGFADGDYVSVKMNKERNSLVVGADGEGARIKLYDNSAQITITLMQTSKANEVLSAYAKSNSEFIFSLIDQSGTTIVAAQHCWIREYPEVAFGTEAKERAWVLETDDCEMIVGGN